MATRMQQRKGTEAQWISTNGGNGPVLNAGEIGYETDTNKFKIGDGINHWVDLNYFADEVALGGNIDDYIPLTQRGTANGVATLNSSGVIPSDQIPSLVGLDSEIATAVTDAINNLVDGAPGALNTLNELAAAVNDDSSYASTVTTALGLKAPVNNPAFTGNVSGVTQAHVGLGNVNNTSDENKPVSIAMQDALDDKANLQSPTFTGTVAGITKSMVGLGNVDNTSDVNKPVSTATATALDLKLSISEADGAAVSAVYNKLNGGDGIDITQDPTSKQITVAIDSTVATETYADGAVSTHSSDTTGVHGITDTANLVTLAGTQELTNKTITDPTIKIGVATVSSTELGYLDGLTTNVNTKFGDIDTALGTKANSADIAAAAQDAVGGSIGTGLSYDTNTNVLSVNQTTMQARVADVSDTEIGYLNGVTSAIQTQIDGKQEVVSGVSSTEIGYLDGVTSAIQTQINAKAPLAGPTFTGTATANNLVVDGDFTVNGTNFSASATSITIEDNLVQLAHQNAANTVDLGIVVGYNDGSAKHAGIARDVSANKWKLFKGVTSEPTTTVDFTQGSLDDLQLNAIEAVNATFTGTVTGVTKTHVGLANVDNTTDANKPVSTATQTALDTKLNSLVTIDPETASYTLILANRDQMVEMNVSSGNTLTVPTNSSVAFPIGTKIHVVQTGTVQTTLTPAGGVTINGTPGLKLRSQWSAVTLIKRSTDTWIAFGDLTA